MRFVYASLCILTSASATRVGWVWGSDNLNAYKRKRGALSDRFPRHGLIEMIIGPSDLRLAVVKRPPEDIYPSLLPFCSKILPIAVNEAYNTLTDYRIHELQAIVVDIEGGPFALRACRCYTALMVDMGIDIINQNTAPSGSFDSVRRFCDDFHPLTLEGRFSEDASPRLSRVDTGYSDALSSASYVVVDGKSFSSMAEVPQLKHLKSPIHS